MSCFMLWNRLLRESESLEKVKFSLAFAVAQTPTRSSSTENKHKHGRRDRPDKLSFSNKFTLSRCYGISCFAVTFIIAKFPM